MGIEVLRRCYADEWEDFWSFVAGMDDDQLAAPSLAAGWTVGDVAAHVAAWDDLLAVDSPSRYPAAIARYGYLLVRARFSMDAVNARLSRGGYSGKPTLRSRHLFDRLAPGGQLAEVVIHHQDIRRALDMRRRIPDERITAALDGVFRLPSLRATSHLRGVRASASDVAWSRGSGPEVRGPAEALLMAIAGRPSALDELDGPGIAMLRDRIA